MGVIAEAEMFPLRPPNLRILLNTSHNQMSTNKNIHQSRKYESFSGLALSVISLNVEGFSRAKQELIAHVSKVHDCHVFCLQEMHRGSTSKNNIEIMTLNLEGVTTTSVYKPPGAAFAFDDNVLQCRSCPRIIIGAFNSHSSSWGYKESNADGGHGIIG